VSLARALIRRSCRLENSLWKHCKGGGVDRPLVGLESTKFKWRDAMRGNPVGWFEIYVQDMDRAKKFYQAVFQVKLEKLDNPEIDIWAFPMVKDQIGVSGALIKMEGFPSGGNSTLVYFITDDCSIESNRVLKAGGRLQREKMSIGQHGFIALAYDTEGNMFGLHSMH
jgi:predicted enzyme related to lactoylglutathione lyase